MDISSVILRPLSVLIATDQPQQLATVTDFFREKHHTYDVSDESDMILHKTNSMAYDLVILDLAATRFNAVDVTQSLRESEGIFSTRLPILGIADAGSYFDENTQMQIGLDAVLHRPFSELVLEGAIQRTIESAFNRVSPTVEDFMNSSLSERFDFDPTFFAEVARVFLADYPRRLERLKLAIEKHDAAEAQSVVHSLKGSLSNFGPSPAYSLIKSIHDSAPGRKFEYLEQEWQHVRKALNSVCAKIQHLCDLISGPQKDTNAQPLQFS